MLPGVRVARLSVTPVKGMALQHPDAVELTDSGAVGDRDLFVVDAQDRLLSLHRTGAFAALVPGWDPGAGRLSITAYGGEEWAGEVERGAAVRADFYGSHAVAGHVVEGPWTAGLSALAGQPVRLVLAAEPGAGSDEHPVTLLGDASIEELARQAGVDAVDPRRFRMLVAVAGAPPHAEDGWGGRELAVGDALLRVGGPVPRCAAVTRHPDRGDRDLPVVRLLKAYRGLAPNEFGSGVNLGVYAEVLRPGTVRVGDPVVLDA